MALTNTNALLNDIIGQDWQDGSEPRGRLGELKASQQSLQKYFAELRVGLNAIGNNINLLLRVKLELEGDIEKLVLELQRTTEEKKRTGAEKDLITRELEDADKKIQVTQEEINSLEQKLTAINNTLADVQSRLEQDKPELAEVKAINDTMRSALGDKLFVSWTPGQQVGGKRKNKKSRKGRKKTLKKYKRKGHHNKKGGYVYSLRKKGKNKSFRKHRK